MYSLENRSGYTEIYSSEKDPLTVILEGRVGARCGGFNSFITCFNKKVSGVGSVELLHIHTTLC